jgi:3-methyl-2-oxobutanoate hydroxymethyltransferase
MKQRGEKISMLTAYDFQTAKLLDEAGIDGLLVGDSVGNVFCGYDTTLPVTLDQLIYHTKVVSRGVERAVVVCDLPFMSYQVGVEDALRNAGRVMKESGAESVKLEGAFYEQVSALTKASIPVMGHLGFTPQSVHLFGGVKVRGKREEQAEEMLEAALRLQDAGCYAIVLEMVPAELSQKISQQLEIPTIGIGSGVNCDGQILVINDILGMDPNFQPKFVKRYADLASTIKTACKDYCDDVKSEQFPADEHSY